VAPPVEMGAAVLCGDFFEKALRRHPMHNITGVKDFMLGRSAR